jgi:hypothetical protein
VNFCHATRVESGGVKLREDLSLQRVDQTQFHSAGLHSVSMPAALTVKIPSCLTDIEFSA